MSAERIVVTGIGVVSPLGLGVESFWKKLLAGSSAIAPLRRFDPGVAGSRLGAEVAELPAREFVPAAQLRRMDRLSQMITVAAVMAAKEAGLAASTGDDLAVVVGSALGNMSESAQFLDRVFQRPSLANPMLFPNLVLNAPASQISIALRWRGPNLTVSEGEISGEVALETAVGMLRRRRARAVVAAAGDELAAVVFRALAGLGALSPRGGGREWSSPFDAGANGVVMGEGAVGIALETAPAAARRGAVPLAIVADVSRVAVAARDPHRWPEAADATGAPAGRTGGLLFSGADSSPERDLLELGLLSRAGATRRPIYSPKGAVGEYGSSGLLGVAVAALSLSSGEIPPLAALERPREGFVFSWPRQRIRHSEREALVLGTARGGSGIAVTLVAP